MQTVLPREEAVEGVISKVLESQEACDRLNEVFYEHLENYQEINDDGDRHFAEVLLQSYKNGDVSALLLELCGGSMFDLLRDAYLIPKKFHGKIRRESCSSDGCERKAFGEQEKGSNSS